MDLERTKSVSYPHVWSDAKAMRRLRALAPALTLFLVSAKAPDATRPPTDSEVLAGDPVHPLYTDMEAERPYILALRKKIEALQERYVYDENYPRLVKERRSLRERMRVRVEAMRTKREAFNREIKKARLRDFARLFRDVKAARGRDAHRRWSGFQSTSAISDETEKFIIEHSYFFSKDDKLFEAVEQERLRVERHRKMIALLLGGTVLLAVLMGMFYVLSDRRRAKEKRLPPPL